MTLAGTASPPSSGRKSDTASAISSRVELVVDGEAHGHRVAERAEGLDDRRRPVAATDALAAAGGRASRRSVST
jgi:hypothetical protein